MKRKFIIGVALAAIFTFASMRFASADPIENGPYDFYALNPAPNGSGLGNYNVILFENAPAGSGNSAGSVNVDNSNILLPTGGNDVSSQSLFWMTSVADLRAFYEQQFSSPINNIVLFLDLNESGNAANSSITIDTLSIYLNESTGLNPGANDLTSAQQGSLTGYTPSTTALTQLTSPQLLAQIATGQGIDDWSIFTFIDPYALPSDATLLFNLQLSHLNSGSEVLSISGTFSACDITNTCGGGSGGSGGGSGGSDGGSGGSDGGSGGSDGGSGGSGGGSGGSDGGSGGSDGGSGGSDGGSGGSDGGSGGSGGSGQIPEPASFLLLGAGLVVLSRVAKRKRD